MFIEITGRIVQKLDEKFGTTITVNYESYITTDMVGADLLFETEKRGFIKIREQKTIQWR